MILVIKIDRKIAQGNRMDRKKIKIDLLIHDLKVPLAVVESGITLLLQKPEKYGPLTAKQEKVLKSFASGSDCPAVY